MTGIWQGMGKQPMMGGHSSVMLSRLMDYHLLYCSIPHISSYTSYTFFVQCQVLREQLWKSTLAKPGGGEAPREGVAYTSALPTSTLSCDSGGYPLSLLKVGLGGILACIQQIVIGSSILSNLSLNVERTIIMQSNHEVFAVLSVAYNHSIELYSIRSTATLDLLLIISLANRIACMFGLFVLMRQSLNTCIECVAVFRVMGTVKAWQETMYLSWTINTIATCYIIVIWLRSRQPMHL